MQLRNYLIDNVVVDDDTDDDDNNSSWYHQQQEEEVRYPYNRMSSSNTRIPHPAHETCFNRLSGYTVNFFFFFFFKCVYEMCMIPIHLFYLILSSIFSLSPRVLSLSSLFVIIWIFWPFVAEIVLTVTIPILNVIIMSFNLFTHVVALSCNTVVQFIDTVLAIRFDVFNAAGSLNWQLLISDLTRNINIIVQIAVEILVILIKGGAEILTHSTKIITPLINVLLEILVILIQVGVEILTQLAKIITPLINFLLEVNDLWIT